MWYSILSWNIFDNLEIIWLSYSAIKLAEAIFFMKIQTYHTFSIPYKMTPTVINLDHNKRGFNGYIISSLLYSVFVVVFHNLMSHYFKEAAKAIIFTSRSPNKSLDASCTLIPHISIFGTPLVLGVSHNRCCWKR